MAGEDDDKNAKSGTDRRRTRDRRRAPVTIDLKAEPTASEKMQPGKVDAAPASNAKPAAAKETPPAMTPDTAAEPAKPEPPSKAAPPPPPPPPPPPSSGQPANSRAEPPRPLRPPGASAIGSDDGWTRPALAGAAGGVAALVLVIILQIIGVLPAPGRSAANQAAEQARTASEAVAAVDRRLSAVEMITQGLPAKGALDALNGRVAALETAQGDLAAKADVNDLGSQLAAVSAKLEAMPAGVTQGDLSDLAARVSRLEEGGATSDGTVDSAAVGALSGRIDTAQASIKALGERIVALEKKVDAAPADNRLAARAIAVVALRRAAESEGPFATDLEMAAALGLPQEDVAALRPFAEAGAPTKATLAAEFPTIAGQIVTATMQSDPNAGFFDRLFAGISGLVSVRPVGPVEGSDPPAIVSRMRAAINAGDLETALKERDALPQAGLDASAEWAARAKNRAAIDALLVKIAQSVATAPAKGPT